MGFLAPLGLAIAHGVAAAGPALAHGGGALAKTASALAPLSHIQGAGLGLQGAGKAALGLGAKGIPSASMPGGGGGGGPLQGLFDAMTPVQSTGKIGQIAGAAKAGEARGIGSQLLQGGAKNLISQGLNSLGGGGGGGNQKQAGGVSFPSVPPPAAPISLPPLPEYNMPSTQDISGLRQQLLQEILAQGGGGGGF